MIPEDLHVPGYDIEERIGRGGMASVYRARQHTFDRNVALKVLKPDLSDDESFCQRFVQESLIVAKLHHSHIVQVYDVGEINKNFYIAMEYLHGGDLQSRLQQGVEIRETVRIIKQAASALDFAHKKGIVHRDIKPDNIMFREDNAAVLTDFGIAKQADSEMNLTQTGLIVGTPKYMAPEQIRGAEVTHLADLYALGILFFQCLTNRVPFDGKDMVATAYAHFNDPVPELPPLVSVFQPIIEKMLAKAPEDRYQSGMAIVEDLEQLTAEEVTTATNLEITRDFVIPESTLDPTIVHTQNEKTVLIAKDGEAQAPRPSNNAGSASLQPSDSSNRPAANFKYVGIAAGAAVALSFLAFFLISSNQSTGVLESPSIVSDQPTTAPIADSADKPLVDLSPVPSLSEKEIEITIARLLTEAQTDIAEKRLKKPDANNAFNKVTRVLSLSPGHPEAEAAMEQIAEEYLKLTDRMILQNELEAAKIYLAHAKSAKPDLPLITTIEAKWLAAKDAKSNQKASILAMEKSLRIDGLLRSAALNEEEGKLTWPAGDNALEKYQRVLQLDASHALAKEKIASLDKL